MGVASFLKIKGIEVHRNKHMLSKTAVNWQFQNKTENITGLDFTKHLTFLRFIEKIQYDKVLKKRVFQKYENNLSIFCGEGGKKIFW